MRYEVTSVIYLYPRKKRVARKCLFLELDRNDVRSIAVIYWNSKRFFLERLFAGNGEGSDCFLVVDLYATVLVGKRATTVIPHTSMERGRWWWGGYPTFFFFLSLQCRDGI